MDMTRTSWGAALALAACAVVATSARAQSLDLVPARSIEPLLGRARGDAPNQLDLTISSAGGYDANVGGSGASGSSLDPLADAGLSFGALSGDLVYTKRLRNGTFAVSDSSSARYYSTGSLLDVQQAVGAGLDLRVGRGTQVLLSESAAYLPYYTYTTLPELFAPDLAPVAGAGPADLAVQKRDHVMSSTAGRVTTALTARTTLSLISQFDTVSFLHDDTAMRSGGASARLSFGLAKGLSLVTGYGLYETSYREPGSTLRIRNHAVDLGVAYDRPLSISRHTTLGFSSGTTAVQDSVGGTQYYVIADARLNHRIGRSWQANGAYHRGLQYVEGLPVPMFSDAFNVSVDGNVARRVSVGSSGGYSKNAAVATAIVAHNEMASGTARLRVALSRQATLTAQYVYYHYRYDAPAVVSPEWPLQLSRQGLHVGIDLWCPVVRD